MYSLFLYFSGYILYLYILYILWSESIYILAVTAHPSTASVPITVLLYDGPLLCSFHVAIKGLTCQH